MTKQVTELKHEISRELKRAFDRIKLMTYDEMANHMHLCHEYMKRIDKGRHPSLLKGTEKHRWYFFYYQTEYIEQIILNTDGQFVTSMSRYVK